MGSREVPLADLFSVERGSGKYTRAYAEAHPGEFPLYSASLSGPMAYIDSARFVGRHLTFTTNGYGGHVQILDGNFTVNGDRAVLIPHKNVLLPDYRYLARSLEQRLRPLAVGRVGDLGRNEYTKLKPEIALAATVPFVLDEDGGDDFPAMERIGSALERSQQLQANIMARASQIRNTNIVLACGRSETVSLGDTSRFSLTIGKRVLRSALDADGEVPVYSANARIPMGYVLAPRPMDSFNKPSLIWGIDGIFDWNLLPAEKPFVPTDHCGRLQVLDPNLDPEYLMHALRATRDDHGFDRVYRSSLSNVAEISVPIPIDINGRFDLDGQADLAKRYRRARTIADNMLDKLLTITNVNVTPS